jgi:hypothetical protein
LDVTQYCPERADFEGLVPMDRNGSPQFILRKVVVTATDTQQLKTVALEKANHFRAGNSRNFFSIPAF